MQTTGLDLAFAACSFQANADADATAAVFAALGGYVKEPHAEIYDNFGYSVAISENHAIVGAVWEDGCGTGVLPLDSPLLADNSCWHSGAAYILERSSSTGAWAYTAYIKAPNATAREEFGNSVAISGDRAIVGSRYEAGCGSGVLPLDSPLSANTSCPNSGAAYILKRSSSTGAWAYTAYIKAPNADAQDRFGLSVAISGNHALVGAHEEDGCGTGILPLDSPLLANNSCTESGAAYMLELNVATGVWAHTVYIKAPNAGADDHFADSVAISGNHAFVGARREAGCGKGVLPLDSPLLADNSCLYSGAAYMFERNTSTGKWKNTAYIKAPNAEASDFFGNSVAISGDHAIVGAEAEDGCGTGVLPLDSPLLANNSCLSSGAVYILKRNISTGLWAHTAYIKAQNTEANDHFGNYVAISGNHAVVSAFSEDGCGTGVFPPGSPLLTNNSCQNSGAVYLLERNVSTGTWAHVAYIKAPNAEAHDEFGFSAAISGDHAIVGAYTQGGCGMGVLPLDSPLLADNSCSWSGAAYILESITSGTTFVTSAANSFVSSTTTEVTFVTSAGNSMESTTSVLGLTSGTISTWLGPNCSVRTVLAVRAVLGVVDWFKFL